jgi:hypothetical protein
MSSRFEVPTSSSISSSNDFNISSAGKELRGSPSLDSLRSEGHQGVGLLIPCPKGHVGSKCLKGTRFPLPAPLSVLLEGVLDILCEN